MQPIFVPRVPWPTSPTPAEQLGLSLWASAIALGVCICGGVNESEDEAVVDIGHADGCPADSFDVLRVVFPDDDGPRSFRPCSATCHRRQWRGCHVVCRQP